MWESGVSVCNIVKVLNLRIVVDILCLKRKFFKMNTDEIEKKNPPFNLKFFFVFT